MGRLNYSENAVSLYSRLYLLPGESIEDCHYRVAKFLGENDNEVIRFKWLLDNQYFRPNSPVLMNAGVDDRASLFACYVLGLEDTMESIVEMWSTLSFIYKDGGGGGINISRLRSKRAPLSKGGFASGPISFLRVNQAIGECVKSGGRSRRAALMVVSDITHPDIMEFIESKSDLSKFTGMNISVGVTNSDMNAIINGESIKLREPNGDLKGEISGKEVWKAIIENAWKCGDPGLLFFDRINRDNPVIDKLGPIEATNPCGEIPLHPWSCCNLGSINLKKIDPESPLFHEVVYWSILFLNRVLDKSNLPSERFRSNIEFLRPVGLGIMGFVDLLVQRGIPYDSEKARQLFSKTCRNLTLKSYLASSELVKEGKIPIPLAMKDSFTEEAILTWIRDNYAREIKSTVGNVYVTCIAPTGSISISADCSYSFEPLFSLAWYKQLSDGNKMEMVYEPIVEVLDKYNLSVEDLVKVGGMLSKIEEIPQEVKDIFKTAHEINPIDRVKMQVAGQKWITMSISSTVNLPNSATIDDIDLVYKTAWRMGLKGITIYRDGCREDQPVQLGTRKRKSGIRKLDRPQIREGKTVEIETPKGKLYIIGNVVDDQLMEIFLCMGRQGSWENSLLNAVGRLISKSLQYQIPLEELVDTLEGCGGDPLWLKLGDRSYLTNGVVGAISTVIDEIFREGHKENKSIKSAQRCPQCGKEALVMIGGCRGGTCLECGYSACS